MDGAAELKAARLSQGAKIRRIHGGFLGRGLGGGERRHGQPPEECPNRADHGEYPKRQDSVDGKSVIGPARDDKEAPITTSLRRPGFFAVPLERRRRLVSISVYSWAYHDPPTARGPLERRACAECRRRLSPAPPGNLAPRPCRAFPGFARRAVRASAPAGA